MVDRCRGHHRREPCILGRPLPPPRHGELVYPGVGDLAHLHAEHRRIVGGVEPSCRVEDRGDRLRRRRAVLGPSGRAAVLRRRRKPRVIEDRYDRCRPERERASRPEAGGEQDASGKPPGAQWPIIPWPEVERNREPYDRSQPLLSTGSRACPHEAARLRDRHPTGVKTRPKRAPPLAREACRAGPVRGWSEGTIFGAARGAA